MRNLFRVKMKAPEQRHWPLKKYIHCSAVSIIEFGQVNPGWDKTESFTIEEFDPLPLEDLQLVSNRPK